MSVQKNIGILSLAAALTLSGCAAVKNRPDEGGKAKTTQNSEAAKMYTERASVCDRGLGYVALTKNYAKGRPQIDVKLYRLSEKKTIADGNNPYKVLAIGDQAQNSEELDAVKGLPFENLGPSLRLRLGKNAPPLTAPIVGAASNKIQIRQQLGAVVTDDGNELVIPVIKIKEGYVYVTDNTDPDPRMSLDDDGIGGGISNFRSIFFSKLGTGEGKEFAAAAVPGDVEPQSKSYEELPDGVTKEGGSILIPIAADPNHNPAFNPIITVQFRGLDDEGLVDQSGVPDNGQAKDLQVPVTDTLKGKSGDFGLIVARRYMQVLPVHDKTGGNFCLETSAQVATYIHLTEPPAEEAAQ
jgi:hypothetical protein